MNWRRLGTFILIGLLTSTGPAALGVEGQVSDAEGLARAVRAARPGDVLVIADGVWNGVDLLLEASGTPEAPIVVRARTTGPVEGAAVGDFPFVADDIDGQPRGSKKDVGCDQVSPEPARQSVPTRGEVGPSWMRSRSAGG